MEAQELHQLFLQQGAVATDSRTIQKGSLFFALSGAQFNGNQFAADALNKGAAYAIIDDKAYIDDNKRDRYILIKDSLKALHALATHHRRYCNTPIIALTGSNGKTTTKELIHEVLKTTFNTQATKGNFNNHIGVPLTLLQLTKETELAIVEMGANHQGEIKQLCEIAEPNYGYITNFGLAHLEGFGSKEGVIKGKSELYDYLKQTKGTIFINLQDPKQKELTKGYNKTIGLNPINHENEVKLIDSKEQLALNYKNQLIPTSLVGAYNQANCAGAIGIGAYFNVNTQNIIKAISSYSPTNNRSQLKETNTNTIILDAYNANPSSMKAALDNFKNLHTTKEKVLILGAMLELGSYTFEAHQSIYEQALTCCKKVYLVGEEFKPHHQGAFQTTLELKDYLKKHPMTNSYLLIKGSRGMALEQLEEVL